MSLTLYHHPLASFCHKVLIALYESGTPFETRIVDFSNPGSAAALFEKWPVGKIPVLHDEARDQVVPETSVIIEYLQVHYPGSVALLPAESAAQLEVRLWDRFFDLYVSQPMQKVVIDRIRPAESKDAYGVAEARSVLDDAYGMIENRMGNRQWAVGDTFSLADCAALPALFFASVVHPFSNHPNSAAYLERLMARESVRRVLSEARPYFEMFPYRAEMPASLLERVG
jgi:glutathione S-transferase